MSAAIDAQDSRLLDAFCDALWLEDGLARNSIEAYRRDLEQLGLWLARERRGALTAVDEAALHAFFAARHRRGPGGRAPRSASDARLLSSLRRFYQYCLRERRVTEDPTLRLEPPKRTPRFPKSLSEADVEALLAAKLASGKTVEETRRELIARIGENIGVRRFEIVSGTAPLATYLHGSRIATVVVIEGGDATLGHDLAMHVAAINPQYLSAEDVPAEQVEKEREIFVAQAATDPKLAGKPKEVLVKASEGKLRKFLGEITLLGQPFVKDDKQTVAQVLKAAGAKVTRYVRYEVGAGIEKKQENFAAEVMAQVRGA
jgi:hypothetical protein